MAFMYPRHFIGMPVKSDDPAWAKNGNGSAPKPAAQLTHTPLSANNEVQNTTQPAELSNPGQAQSQVHVQDVHDYNSDEIGGDEIMDEA
ncbi:hypothetical protein DdX_01583 [Ditylenchus destructor]|uniref:Uncharacterized protein n=1 Tax=Ditylenchus destructor TaxID=166010 RepID=A0AAD4NJ21_9BILA|nr:hypothetical protein DdX_01583 [Ditylenchus destructor]